MFHLVLVADFMEICQGFFALSLTCSFLLILEREIREYFAFRDRPLSLGVHLWSKKHQEASRPRMTQNDDCKSNTVGRDGTVGHEVPGAGQ